MPVGRTCFVFVLCALFFAFARPSYAEFRVDGHVDARLHLDRADEDGGIYEGYPDSHITAEMFLPWGFSVTTELLLEGEPSGHDHAEHGHDGEDEHGEEEDEHEHDEDEGEDHDEHGDDEHADEGDNAFFGDHSLTLEEFALNFRHGFGAADFALYGGKFTPAFSLDEHSFPGVYTYRMVHDYMFDPRVGLGGAVGVNADDFGSHRFDLSFFARDTTVFSNRNGKRRRKSDGGVSNTGDLSSFALSIGGGGFYSLRSGLPAALAESFSYRFGYAKQAKGAGNDRDESRYAISIRNFRQFTPNLSAVMVSEYIAIKNLGGEADRDRKQVSIAVGFDWKKWTLAGGGAWTDNTALEPDEGRDGSMFSFSLSRAVGKMKIGAGYQRVKEEGETSSRVGALLSWHGGFSSAGGRGHDGHVH